MQEKRGQLTIFVILGILILASVFLTIYFLNPELLGVETIRDKPDTFEFCVKENLEGLVQEIALTAGFTGSYFNVTYNGVAIPYACYTDEYYKPCIVQVPFLEKEFERSLNGQISSKVSACYDQYLEDFRRQGYDVKAGSIQIESELQKDRVILEILAPSTVSDGSTSSGTEEIRTIIPSKVYDTIMKANNIVQFETTYGEYDLIESQLLYPDLPITAKKLDDGSVIYTIHDQEIKYQFAVRSYVNPPGYGF